MRVLQKSKCQILKVGIITIILLFGITNITVADDTSTVSIDPSSQTVSSGENFTVNVSCVLDQPIKSFEFKLSFDASLLQINSVTEGDIFSGYSTFFSSGTIDNTAGTVVGIYDLIVGPGNVSGSGKFVTINCTAKDMTGISSLDLYEVGVTDEAGYLPVTANDGSATVQGTDDPDPPGGGGSSGGGGGGYYPPPGGNGNTTGQNNSPETPIKPSGPTFVEIGVEYTYSSSTYDVDGDQIRYRFDWDDGTYSDWSEFTMSNMSISLSNSWNLISTYEIKVMAQDKNGMNSSWSSPLEVIVSQAASGEIPPVTVINFSSNESNHLIIKFDASGSFDPDRNISSYIWDFGDGENGTGISPIHTYAAPGKYTVTLEVTDNNSNVMYSKSVIITVGSEVEQKSAEKDLPLIYIVVGGIGFAVAIFVCLAIFFRVNIGLFFSQHHTHMFSSRREHIEKEKIDKLDAKIQELKRMQKKIDYEKISNLKMDKQHDETVKDYSKIQADIDSKVESTLKKEESFDGVYTQNKIEEDGIANIANIEREVDDFILSKTQETPDKEE